MSESTGQYLSMMTEPKERQRHQWQTSGALVMWCVGVLAHRYHSGRSGAAWNRWNKMTPGEQASWIIVAKHMLAGDYCND